MDFSLTIALDPPTATVVANGELDIFTARRSRGSWARRSTPGAAGCWWTSAA
jgi:hypothetical protein